MTTAARLVADHAIGVPAAPLRPYVRRYTGYRFEGFTPGVHLGLPSRDLTVIVTIDEPLQVAVPADGPTSRLATAMSGLTTGPAVIRHDGCQHGVQLDLTPAGARALLGMPAGELATTVAPLDEALRSTAQELAERLAAASTWPQRFAILDEGLSRQLGALPAPDPHLAEAWRRIVDSGGDIRVGALAQDLGWSRRHLGERFTREYGVTMKDLARIARFERSVRLLRSPARPSLADVATMSGYYDQPHLTREWGELAGCSPTRWLATEELPSVQDGDPTDGARSEP